MKLWMLCGLLALVAAERQTFEGYKVYQFTLNTEEQAKDVIQLMDDVELDFWREPSNLGEDVVVMVTPERIQSFEQLLSFEKIVYKEIMQDLDQVIKEQYASIDSRDSFNLDDWNEFEWIIDELDNMAARCPASLTCSTRVIGQSTEGRDLKMLTISGGSGRDAIWIDSLIHAREWLAGATVLKIIDRLTRDYDSDAEVQELIDSYDWHFLPVMNPDGYVYTHNTNRMWRKSRNINTGSSCRGVDLNRNYNYNWNTGGSSGNPCSDTYRGRAAASEIETQFVAAEADRIGGSNIMSWATVHTFGYYWLTPYGDCSAPPDNDDLMQVVDAICDAIFETSNRRWACGNSCRTLYATSGSTSDWTRGALGVKYSYTPELRGPGFTPPASEIQPSYEEIWNGFLAMVREIGEVEG